MICSTSLTTGPKPPHRDGRMVASRYTRKVQPCRRTYRPRRSRSTRRPKRRPGHLGRARPVHFHRRQRVPQGARPGGRDAVRDEGQDAGARREDGEIAGKSTWGDRTLTIDPTDLEHIAPLPDSNPARGRLSCNFKKMIGAECQSWSNRAKSIQQFR